MATKELRASSSDIIPIEFLYAGVLPLRTRILILIAARGGMSSTKGCWMARKTMAAILDTEESRVEREIRELVNPRAGGRGTAASPKLVRVIWEDEGKKREGFRLIVSEEESIKDSQLEALSNRAVRYCRAVDLEETREAVQDQMDAGKGWPVLFLMTDFDIDNIGTGKELIAYQRKLKAGDAWMTLNEAWGCVPWLPKFLDVKKESRFWKSVVSNAALNPCPWAKKISDPALRAQVAVLAVADHLVRKTKAGKPPIPKDPASFFCGLLKSLDPQKDDVHIPNADAVLADVKLFGDGDEVWDIRNLAESDHPPQVGELINLEERKRRNS